MSMGPEDTLAKLDGNLARLPALTVHQPWAGMIAAGHKRIEFRTRPCPKTIMGKQIAIHASRREPSSKELDSIESMVAATVRDNGHIDVGAAVEYLWRFDELRSLAVKQWYVPGDDAPEVLALGSIVAVATVTGSLSPKDVAGTFGGTGDRSLHGWTLGGIVKLETPVPCLGQQGIWYVKGIELNTLGLKLRDVGWSPDDT